MFFSGPAERKEFELAIVPSTDCHCFSARIPRRGSNVAAPGCSLAAALEGNRTRGSDPIPSVGQRDEALQHLFPNNGESQRCEREYVSTTGIVNSSTGAGIYLKDNLQDTGFGQSQKIKVRFVSGLLRIFRLRGVVGAPVRPF